jgi:hypothetical protein
LYSTSTWLNGVWFGRLVSGEFARTLAAVDTAFVAVARALASSVSDLDLSLVVLVARPAFWAA